MLIGQLLDRRYRIIKVLSSSGLGETFLAADTRRPGYPQCIVKQLQLPSNGSGTSQLIKLLLKKKAEILERLGENPHIPELLAYFEDNQSFYLVEEFIPGKTLKEEIGPSQPWSEDKVIDFLTEALEILAFVHDRGVIHRELKPENFIRRQTDNQLVLINFGLVKEINSQISRQKLPQGSGEEPSAYIPNEQAQGNANFNSDIYALGMMAWQALAGIGTEDLLKLRVTAPNEELAWPTIKAWSSGKLPENVNSQVAEILAKMTRSHFAARYQSANEALEDLKKLAIVPEEIELPPIIVVPEEKPVPISPRRFSVLAAASFVLVLLVLGAMASLPQRMVATYLTGQGNSKQEKEDYPGAISTYNQALKLNPKDAGAYFNRGMALYRQANWQEAMNDFTQAIQINPKESKAYHYRGNSRMYLGDNQGAIADYNLALQVNPKFVPAYLSRGNVRADIGDEGGAVSDYNKAIEIDPNFAPAYLNRCLSLSNIGNQEAAIADCSRAIQINPSYTFAYQNRGLARFRNRDYRGAIEDFNIAIKFNPKDADPYYNRGLVRYELGDKTGAIADFNLAININPQHALVYYDRGLALMDINEREKALEDFQLSAKICLEQGRTGCYKDAQYQIEKLAPAEKPKK